ncbi:developmentally-regulated G-protein 3 [Dorcoceras hygrometricum]|uniref:Developmentally-regulated G-protein 3 n=1 Tax=Dorcoceras hygrometricum TaxID=472368 RepID=A0A2Z7DGC0_9LAMI|nr:developmentally-regulated G-protein 3 [Dorcoceras hygrometricum]
MVFVFLSVTSIEQEKSVNRYLLYTIDAYLLTDSILSPQNIQSDSLRIFDFRQSSQSKSIEMASTFIANSYQVNFDSVLLISDHDGMLNMFKALEASVLRGFLGCESVLYEKELEQFFDTALIQDGDITGAISGKYFSVSQSQFAEVDIHGKKRFMKHEYRLLNDIMANGDITGAISGKYFSVSQSQFAEVDIHGKKRFMKHEYRLLNDIMAKAITVKAGSFDAVTNERFMIMTAIHFGLKVNWSKVLFGVLKDMVDRTQKKAKGYAAQIGVLLKIIPAITMGEAVPFPPSKILSIKTVNTYIAMNHTIDARGQSDEPGMANVAVVKRKSKSKKKSETTDETPVEIISEVAGSNKRPAVEDSAPVIPKKRRTLKGKASLDVVPVAQDFVPLQIIESTPAATVVKSPAPKRISRKRRLVLPTGSDDEIMDTQKPVKDTDEIAEKHTDEIDDIIDIGDDFDQWLEESFKDFVVNETGTVVEAESSKVPVVEKDMDKAVGSKHTEEEHMSIDDLLLQISDDMMLLSVTAAEITKIRLGESININEVQERDWYYASLPRISTHDKGKEPLEENEPVIGNPAKETVELICGDVDFLVQLRDKVMTDVVDFFHSFSLNKLSDFDGLRDLKEKEKLMLSWAETEFLETAVKRRMYILAKYREMLLRKFLDSHR